MISRGKGKLWKNRKFCIVLLLFLLLFSLILRSTCIRKKKCIEVSPLEGFHYPRGSSYHKQIGPDFDLESCYLRHYCCLKTFVYYAVARLYLSTTKEWLRIFITCTFTMKFIISIECWAYLAMGLWFTMKFIIKTKLLTVKTKDLRVPMWKQKTSGYQCENKKHVYYNYWKKIEVLDIRLPIMRGVELWEGNWFAIIWYMQLLGWHGLCAAVICIYRLVMHCFSYFPVRVRRDKEFI